MGAAAPRAQVPPLPQRRSKSPPLRQRDSVNSRWLVASKNFSSSASAKEGMHDSRRPRRTWFGVRVRAATPPPRTMKCTTMSWSSVSFKAAAVGAKPMGGGGAPGKPAAGPPPPPAAEAAPRRSCSAFTSARMRAGMAAPAGSSKKGPLGTNPAASSRPSAPGTVSSRSWSAGLAALSVRNLLPGPSLGGGLSTLLKMAFSVWIAT